MIKSFWVTLAKTFIILVMALALSSPILAQDEDEDDVMLDLSNVHDFKTLSGMDVRLAPHGNDLMGDMIDKNTGGISFQHTDISIPGNSGLEVALRRKITQGSAFYTPFQQGFGDWVLDLPIAHITYGFNSNSPAPVFNNGCLNNLGVMDSYLSVTTHNTSTELEGRSHTSGSVLYVPGKGLSGHPGDLKNPADPQSDWTSATRTTDHAGRCATQVIAPDGTKYKFGRHTFRHQDTMDIPVILPFFTIQSNEEGFAAVFRKYAVYLITEVEDVNGNWVRYDYTNDSRAELTRIHSNDGRDIRLFYTNSPTTESFRNSRLITHITANDRRWDYEYAAATNVANGRKVLYKSILPDGRYWQFGDDSNINTSGLNSIQYEPHEYYKCVPFEVSFHLKHPDGAVGSFELRETRHIKNAVRVGFLGDDEHYIAPRDIPHYTNNSECSGTSGTSGEGFSEYSHQRPHGWPVFQAMSVAQKKISGQDIPTATWDFEYRDYSGGALDNNWTLITEPDGTKRTYTYQALGFDRGLLKSINVVPTTGTGETMTYEHGIDGDGAPGGTYGLCRADGDNPLVNAGNCQVYKKRPITKMTHQRDGDTFTNEYSYNFGTSLTNYASGPVSVKRYSNVSTNPRITETEYEHKTDKWVLGLPNRITQNGREMATYVYDANGRKTSQTRYGQDWTTYTYHNSSNMLGRPFRITDSLGRVTELRGWKRGTAQQVVQAAGTNDEIRTWQYVDNNGWVTRTKDALNRTTTYTRDNMGRLTLIDPHGSWANTEIDYDFAGGGAEQTITKGQSVDTITYDAMFRPILERTQALDTGWSSYINTEYDNLGRVTFKSQPSTSSVESKGTDFTYDGLGRIIEERENVSPYARTKHTYYSLHRYRVTDPSGAFTQYFSYGYDGPGNSDYRAIYKYADGTYQQRTYLSKNVHGQLTNLRQWGGNGGYSVDKRQLFYYDSQQRLCRHYVPEHGATKYEYDNAGQMTAYAKGQANNSSSCGGVLPNTDDTVRMLSLIHI